MRNVYKWFDNSFPNLLYDSNVINNKQAPQAQYIIFTHSIIDDRWYLLFIPLAKRCLFLGDKFMDVATEITMLHLTNADTLHPFNHRVQEIQTKLQYSQVNVNTTRLVKFY